MALAAPVKRKHNSKLRITCSDSQYPRLFDSPQLPCIELKKENLCTSSQSSSSLFTPRHIALWTQAREFGPGDLSPPTVELHANGALKGCTSSQFLNSLVLPWGLALQLAKAYFQKRIYSWFKSLREMEKSPPSLVVCSTGYSLC